MSANCLKLHKQQMKHVQLSLWKEICTNKQIHQNTPPNTITLDHHVIPIIVDVILLPISLCLGDMSQCCFQGSKPKTDPQRTQKENIPKQRKYKYFTSLKLWSPKFENHFYQKNPSHHKEYLTSKYSTSQQVFFYKSTQQVSSLRNFTNSQPWLQNDHHEKFMI